MKKNPYINTPPEEQPRPDVTLLKQKIEEKFPQDALKPDWKPIVTVITAVFNAIKDGRKEELLQCLGSVQEQINVAVEHLIIDGASSDGTLDLIKNYRNFKFPIRILSEPDTGIYDAMNRGVWLARGKYVIFLNSDDYYFNPIGLAESVKYLENSSADFSYAPVSVLSETTGMPIEHVISRPNVNMIFIEMPFSHQSMMIRREVMRKINGFDLRYSSGADYDSVLRMIFTGCHACFVPVSFVSFRLGGFSFVNVEQSQQEVGTIFSRLYKKYLNINLSPEDGKKIYLTKRLPKELKQRQFSFASVAFGDAIGKVCYQENSSIPDDDLLLLRHQLSTLNRNHNCSLLIKKLLLLLVSSPVYLFEYLWIYCRICRNSGKKNADEKAIDELLSGLQANRRRKNLLSMEQNKQKIECCVTNQDYWCTNGLYMPEIWGSWAGKIFSVFFKIPEDYLGCPLTAQIDIGGYVFPEAPVRTVNIAIGDRKIDSLHIKNMMPQSYFFSIPEDAITSGVLDIDFISDQAFIPNELGHSNDTRELGILFKKLLIKKANADIVKKENLMIPQELKIGFLNHFNKWWVGGITYFKNLFIAMSTTESPCLKPFIFPPTDEIAECLLPYVSTFPISPSSADPEHLRTAADYKMDILSHLNGNQVSDGCDGIAWIADFQHIHLPEMFDAQEIDFRNRSFHSLIEQNRIVCLSSYDAMEDFKKYAPEAAHKARCLHFVSIPEFDIYQISEEDACQIRRKRQLPERYFYVPNQFWKHKNHIVVLQAIALLKKAGYPIHVAFSGNTYDSRFPHYFEELTAFCRKEQIEENAHFLGLLPLKEVYFLMRDCLAMINPSRFEGWSSSVEEAKSIGKTIFLSNLNVHYEQMPPRGIYFPCNDAVWLADLLKRAWKEMKPGPDVAMEEKARLDLPLRIKQFGKDFQRIVMDAIENKNSYDIALQSMPEVTVVTVVRSLEENGQKEQIIRNLKSVIAQKNVSLEHLIVDCDLSGKTQKFLNPYMRIYGCKLISEPAHGLYGAMNLGSVHARGKYISYLNLENVYASDNFLRKSVESLEKDNFDFSYTENFDCKKCFTQMPFSHSSMLFLRKALYSVAGYNDTLESAGEYDLVLRLIFSGKRGIKVDCTGTNQTIGFQYANTESTQREYCLIYSRLYRRLGYTMSPDEGVSILNGKEFPEKICRKFESYYIHTFAAKYSEFCFSQETEKNEDSVSRESVPLVSVILPLSGSVRFLEERIASIRRQTFENYEVIIVNADLSEENMTLLRIWAEEDSRVHIFIQKENFLNYGVSKSKGRYLYFALSEQSMSPECLERMSIALNEHPECSICDTRLLLIDHLGNPVSDEKEFGRYFGHLSYPMDQEHVRLAPYDFFSAVCGKKIYTSLSQLMIRRNLFRVAGEFPEDAGNAWDYLWEMRASLHGNTIYLPQYLVFMRLNFNDLNTSDGICWNFNEIYRCVEQILTELQEGPIKTAACGLATLPHFKKMLLPLKQSYSLAKKILFFLNAARRYPKKSIELIFLVLKFSCLSSKRRCVSIRANNLLISARMKYYKKLICSGQNSPYLKFSVTKENER